MSRQTIVHLIMLVLVPLSLIPTLGELLAERGAREQHRPTPLWLITLYMAGLAAGFVGFYALGAAAGLTAAECLPIVLLLISPCGWFFFWVHVYRKRPQHKR